MCHRIGLFYLLCLFSGSCHYVFNFFPTTLRPGNCLVFFYYLPYLHWKLSFFTTYTHTHTHTHRQTELGLSQVTNQSTLKATHHPLHFTELCLFGCVKINSRFLLSGSTWTGPAWSPAQSISSVLISIQSLMTENPYHNEPGFEQERHPGDSKNYNECIRHETIRVAVCDMLEGKCPCPEPLRGVMEKSFMEYYDFYEGVCKERLHLQGQTMQDPFGEKRGHFDYQSLLLRLQGIRLKVQEKHQQENPDIDSESSSSETETDTQGSIKA
ncbi:UBC core domain-containing protein [Podarcis lilfordi]|uniref:E2 ubiquitin-conjugating enzyme n=1 Tax=Podarcis lilfordi TaxID=74358 RepID=A0AA35PLD1_9SAUR|nr:UBC core domain-containing protein [Podarcis lilfordi]